MNGAEGSAYLSELIDDCLNSGVTVHSVNQRFARVYKGVTIDRIGDLTTVSYRLSPITPFQAMIKRLIDIISGIIGSAIAIVLIPFIAVIIMLNDPGPIFFKHRRVGRNGREFGMYKFRTMYVNADSQEKLLLEKSRIKGPMIKVTNDPRIYRGGSFLRRSSLDEFPQFFNILKGDMSLVGTRPPSLTEYEQYDLRHKKRLAMKPGLTGLWQVSGRSNIEDFDAVVALDEKYMLEYSLFNDFVIIFKTIPAVFLKRGAS
jgi:lipopolysaccharide/colanic/teichoic acid biosynthesis glycosyltransferase